MNEYFEPARLIRFGLVGVFNTLFGYGLYLGLLFFGLEYWAAWLGALVASVLVGFVLAGRVVFPDAASKSFVIYLVCWVGVYLLNVGFLKLLIGFGIPEELAPIGVLPVNVLGSYVLQRTVVFRGKVDT